MKSPLALISLLALPFFAFSQFSTEGDASSQGGGCYRLTDDDNNEIGAAWSNVPMDLTAPFDVVASVFLGNSNGGGDGMAFVIRNSSSNDLQPNQMPGPDGQYLGYGTIDESVIVEIDTDDNNAANDPNWDHLSVLRDGNPDHDAPSCLFDPVPALPDFSNIEDNDEHLFRVTWNPENDSLKVYFDCFLRIATTVDIPSIIGDTEGIWGFVACTESEENEHRFCELDAFEPAELNLADVELCAGQTATINLPDGFVVDWSPTAGLSGTAGSTIVVSPAVTTTYTASWLDACGNTVEASFTATVNDAEFADAVPDLQMCNGAPVLVPFILVPPGFAVGWESVGGQIPASIDEPGTYTVFVTNAEGCTDEQSLTVTNVDLPVVNLGSDIELCPGTSYTFDAGVADAVWADNSVGPTYTANGPETVTATVGSGTCSVTTAVEVTSVQAYEPVWSSEWTLCAGAGVLVLDAADGNWDAADVAYEWLDGSAESTFEVDAPGPVEVDVVAGGCSYTFVTEVQVSEITSVDLGPDETLCPGDAVEWNVPYPDAWVTWWNEGNAVGFGDSFIPDAAGTYLVEVSHAGCTVQDEAAVDWVPDYEVDGGANLILCQGESVILDATDSNWNGGEVTFAWQGGPNAASWEVDQAGLYAVDVTASGCPHTFDLEVVASEVPEVDLGLEVALCEGEVQVVSSGAPDAITSWLWNGNALVAGVASVTVEEAGTLTCLVDDGVCAASDEVEVSELPAFDAQLPLSLSFCEGESATLLAAAGAEAYEWVLPDASLVFGSSLTINQPGTTVLNTDYLGCEASFEVSAVEVPLPSVDLGEDIGICEGSSVVLEVSADVDWVQWNGSSYGASFEVQESSTVTVVVSDLGCTNQDEVQVEFYPTPEFDLGPNQHLCAGGTALLAAEGLPSGATLDWTGIGSNANPLVVNASGTYQAVASLGGCTFEDAVTVLVAAEYDPSLPEFATLCSGETDALTAAPADTLFATWYAWSPGGDGLSTLVDHEGTYTFTAGNACGTWSQSVFVEVEDCACSVFVPSAFTPDNDGRNDRFIPKFSCEPTQYAFEVLDRWGVRFFYTEDPSEGWLGQIPDGEGDDHPYFGPQDLYVWRVIAVFERDGVARHEVYTGQVTLLR